MEYTTRNHANDASSTLPELESGTSSSAGTESKEADRRSLHLTDQTNLLPFKKIIACFSGLALCIVVSTLDTVIVATAIPTISAAFKAGSIVSWVPSAYLLTSTSFQPLYGRFSDIFGRKAAICVAMFVFMVGNLLAGFSRSIVQLIVFRGIAGAGGGEFSCFKTVKGLTRLVRWNHQHVPDRHFGHRQLTRQVVMTGLSLSFWLREYLQGKISGYHWWCRRSRLYNRTYHWWSPVAESQLESE